MALPGNVVGGKYRILDPIADGAMGSVWKAVHVTLERPFAVKFLKDTGAQTARLEDRFLNEARRAAAVRHRFVVDVVDFGRTDEGTPYMVMEYLKGVSLAERLRQKPRPTVQELLQIMQQALEGLDAVHRAGVLHRDLKPENIVLCSEGDAVWAKLVDFGISRELYAESVDAKGNRLTSPGTTLGTPWYMAPEQVQGGANVDQRCDIYAAGVVLYEALTGRLPYMDEDLDMVLLMVSAGGATPISQRRPDLPGALSALVDRALALDPLERFPTGREMATALGQVAAEVAPEARCLRSSIRPPRPRSKLAARKTRPALDKPEALVLAARGEFEAKLAPVEYKSFVNKPPSGILVDPACEIPQSNPALAAAHGADSPKGDCPQPPWLDFLRTPPRPVVVGAGAVLGCVLLALTALLEQGPSLQPGPAAAREHPAVQEPAPAKDVQAGPRRVPPRPPEKPQVSSSSNAGNGPARKLPALVTLTPLSHGADPGGPSGHSDFTESDVLPAARPSSKKRARAPAPHRAEPSTQAAPSKSKRSPSAAAGERQAARAAPKMFRDPGF